MPGMGKDGSRAPGRRRSCRDRAGGLSSWLHHAASPALFMAASLPRPSSLPMSRCLQERRKEMTKTVAKLGEEGKVALRNVRRDAMKAIEKLEKDGDISGGCG